MSEPSQYWWQPVDTTPQDSQNRNILPEPHQNVAQMVAQLSDPDSFPTLGTSSIGVPSNSSNGALNQSPPESNAQQSAYPAPSASAAASRSPQHLSAPQDEVNADTDEPSPAKRRGIDDCINDFVVSHPSLTTKFPRFDLAHGDTWAFIQPPAKQPDQTFGEYQEVVARYSMPLRVSSSVLRESESALVLKQLSSPTIQFRLIRRLGVTKEKMERLGIKFVLDLTPPVEGDEAVELTEELCCPPSIVQWARTSQQWRTSAQLVGGVDELTPVTEGKIEDRPLVADYTPLRHRMSIERVLSILYGLDPWLDSAPKIYTTVLVATKHLRIPAHKLLTLGDYVTRWVRATPNSFIVELHPEVILKLADELQIAPLCQDAFAVLVGEAALQAACHPTIPSSSLQSTKHGRARGAVHELWQSRIEYARIALEERMKQQFFDFLTHEEMKWIEELDAVRSIKEHVASARIERYSSWLRSLKKYVQGAIYHVVIASYQEIETPIQSFRTGASYDRHITRNIFNSLDYKARIMTRTLWKILKELMLAETDSQGIMDNMSTSPNRTLYTIYDSIGASDTEKGLLAGGIITNVSTRLLERATSLVQEGQVASSPANQSHDRREDAHTESRKRVRFSFEESDNGFDFTPESVAPHTEQLLPIRGGSTVNPSLAHGQIQEQEENKLTFRFKRLATSSGEGHVSTTHWNAGSSYASENDVEAFEKVPNSAALQQQSRQFHGLPQRLTSMNPVSYHKTYDSNAGGEAPASKDGEIAATGNVLSNTDTQAPSQSQSSATERDVTTSGSSVAAGSNNASLPLTSGQSYWLSKDSTATDTQVATAVDEGDSTPGIASEGSDAQNGQIPGRARVLQEIFRPDSPTNPTSAFTANGADGNATRPSIWRDSTSSSSSSYSNLSNRRGTMSDVGRIPTANESHSRTTFAVDRSIWDRVPNSNEPATYPEAPQREPLARIDLRTILRQAESHIHNVAYSALRQPNYGMLELDTIDTLVSVEETETLYLPLWAGGMDDGSGGVFNNDPPIMPDAEFSFGPGRVRTSGDEGSDYDNLSSIGDSTANTSKMVNDGISVLADRRHVYAASEVESVVYKGAVSDTSDGTWDRISAIHSPGESVVGDSQAVLPPEVEEAPDFSDSGSVIMAGNGQQVSRGADLDDDPDDYAAMFITSDDENADQEFANEDDDEDMMDADFEVVDSQDSRPGTSGSEVSSSAAGHAGPSGSQALVQAPTSERKDPDLATVIRYKEREPTPLGFSSDAD